ncbi:hypothetical protein [Cellulomonas cellasea]|uniref:CU044_5270 family protein n=2 Tax=Cellulomonas cellasea TaxID=43670 RepID=A0A0A0B4A9_9CELL|nr:hypothetical protein [Cellulomonas cellasea]KGM00998.1 hypothetical protein Q760_04595 [Cellulomonas cellasea DSM 20118]GEA86801.1 hypothetical protein CCE01nite_07500 [Cellulomonas cellasea]
MTTDDDAQDLLARLDAVVPRIGVRTSRVIPRARRRRALRRTVGTLVLAGVVAGTGWVAQAQPWSPRTVTLLPAQPTAEAPSAPAEPTPTAAADPADGSPIPPGAWWYTLNRSTGPDGEVSTSETWISPHQPGLGASNGDYANADSFGPRQVIGTFVIDGERVEMLRDVSRLPTDPAALEQVFRASIEPDRRSGTDDEKVYGMAYDLLIQSGLPEGLRHAAWAVAAGLPGTTVTSGSDATGRPGEVLDRPGAENGAPHLVRDPATGLLLELGSGLTTTVVVEQRLVHSLPVEPSLENSGCTAWESC